MQSVFEFVRGNHSDVCHSDYVVHSELRSPQEGLGRFSDDIAPYLRVHNCQITLIQSEWVMHTVDLLCLQSFSHALRASHARVSLQLCGQKLLVLTELLAHYNNILNVNLFMHGSDCELIHGRREEG